jgi:ribonuclease VapC
LSNQPEVVLDASALLAFLFQEAGGGRVERALESSLICSVNWAEVVQKSLARSVNVERARAYLSDVGLEVIPFSEKDAFVAAHIWLESTASGLSLADRSCIALARRLGLPVLTADRAWGQVPLDVDVQLIR